MSLVLIKDRLSPCQTVSMVRSGWVLVEDIPARVYTPSKEALPKYGSTIDLLVDVGKGHCASFR